MNVISIAALCLTACIAAKAIEKDSGGIKAVLIIAAAAAVALKASYDLLEVKSIIESLFMQSEMDDSYLEIIFKALGICYITRLAADCCRDCGENALASQMTIAGKAAMIIVSLPLFRAVLEIIQALLV